MKTGHKCPKCGGTDISHVDGTRAAVMKIKTGVTSAATVSLYVCLGCGFCETWIDSKIDLGDLGRMYPPKKA
jgi:hypothetical protein